jgi:hypothetical protein
VLGSRPSGRPHEGTKGLGVAGLKLLILLSSLLECWNYRCVLPHPTRKNVYLTFNKSCLSLENFSCVKKIFNPEITTLIILKSF